MIRAEAIEYWSDTGNEFVTEVAELPGCAADGRSEQEALAKASKVGKRTSGPIGR